MKSAIYTGLILLIVGGFSNMYTSCDQVQFSEIDSQRVYLKELSNDDINQIFSEPVEGEDPVNQGGTDTNNPDSPDSPDAPVVPDSPDSPETPVTPDSPDAPVMPDADNPEGDDPVNTDGPGNNNPPVQNDPPVSGADNPVDGDNPEEEIEEVVVRCGKDGRKVLVCHIPSGNPAALHEICIGESAVRAHQGHHGGDYLGYCDGQNQIESEHQGDDEEVEVEVEEEEVED